MYCGRAKRGFRIRSVSCQRCNAQCGCVDRNVPLANPRTMQDVLGRSVLRRKFAMLILSIFAGLNAARHHRLVHCDLVFRRANEQRKSEFASRSADNAATCWDGLAPERRLVLIGLLGGLPVALGATRLLGACFTGSARPIS